MLILRGNKVRYVAILLLAATQCTFHVQAADSISREAAVNGFVEQVTEHFKAWDKDQNGKLSAGELDALALDTKTTGNTAAVVAALKRTLNNTKVKSPELTLENIIKLSKAPPAEGPNFGKMYSEGLSKVSKAKRVLFASDLPQMSALHQGRLGDCFCLAPLGAMLNRDPKQVAAMFQAQDDGKCKVTLGKKTVTVAMPTDTELAMSASARSDGIWVNLYEKAVGSLRMESKPEKEQTGLALDAVAHGGSAGTILATITGHEIMRISLKFAKDEKLPESEKAEKLKRLREQLISATAEKRLMTCGTQVTTTPGLTPNHAYAILEFDEKADTLKLWNPHGTNFTPKGEAGLANGYPRKDGIFTIPLGDFVKQFTGTAFEQVPK